MVNNTNTFSPDMFKNMSQTVYKISKKTKEHLVNAMGKMGKELGTSIDWPLAKILEQIISRLFGHIQEEVNASKNQKQF